MCASLPIIVWKCSTIIGNGCGPTTEPIAYKAVSYSFEYAINASSTASFRVIVPLFTETIFAPNIFILSTLGLAFWISVSPMYISHSSPNNAAAVAVATPCCPAPVSAIILVFPILLANNASPKQ